MIVGWCGLRRWQLLNNSTFVCTYIIMLSVCRKWTRHWKKLWKLVETLVLSNYMLKYVVLMDVLSFQLSRNLEANIDSTVWSIKEGHFKWHISPYEVATSTWFQISFQVIEYAANVCKCWFRPNWIYLIDCHLYMCCYTQYTTLLVHITTFIIKYNYNYIIIITLWTFWKKTPARERINGVIIQSGNPVS